MALEYRTAAEFGLEPEQVGAFYTTHWRRKIALNCPEFYQWQSKQLPTAVGIDNCMMAYDKASGTIVGVMRLHARPFIMDGRTVAGAELTSWVVDERFRALGAGSQMLNKIQRRYDMLIGMGISNAAIPVYLRSGFQYLRAIPRFVRVIDFAAVAKVSKVTPRRKSSVVRGESRITWTSLRRKESAVPKRSLDAPTSNLFLRDTAHLTWRFVTPLLFATEHS